jgi:ABC-2 type transport system permease protein
MSALTASPLRANLSALLSSTRTRLLIISRYPGQLLTDILIPIAMAAMPILMGRANAGDQAGAVFAANTGTANYVAYMIIGSCVFSMVSTAFWHIAYWLRWEMETGTLEMLYLTPTERIWVAGGTALYSMIRGISSGLLAYIIGSKILRVDPFEGEILLAMVFIVIGLVPLYGTTLLFGAIVLKIKEANALINLMQWGVSFLMGVYYPVSVLPPLVRAFAMLFPPTWMTNGVRSAILGIGYFFGEWYFDLAILWVFLIIAPLIGYQVFRMVEANVRRNEGVGTF